MNISEMIGIAQLHGRCEQAPYLVVRGPTVYKDGHLLLAMQYGCVTAFQCWTRSDAAIINAVVADDRYHCTWSETLGAHLVEYNEDRRVRHADDPISLFRRVNP